MESSKFSPGHSPHLPRAGGLRLAQHAARREAEELGPAPGPPGAWWSSGGKSEVRPGKLLKNDGTHGVGE